MFDLHALDAPVIDVEMREEVKEMLGDEYLEMEQEFLLDAQAKVQAMQNYDCNGNLDELCGFAHSLVSSGGNLGFAAFSNICRALDESIRTHELDKIAQRIDAVVSQFKRLQETLKS